jgi:osmotically-inducible protein OsmY
MEVSNEKPIVTAPDGAMPPDLRAFVERSRRFLKNAGHCGECRLEVEKRGRWFVLRGRVGSQLVKSRLIGMVPKIEGAQWIEDRLHVHSPEPRSPDG